MIILMNHIVEMSSLKVAYDGPAPMSELVIPFVDSPGLPGLASHIFFRTQDGCAKVQFEIVQDLGESVIAVEKKDATSPTMPPSISQPSLARHFCGFHTHDFRFTRSPLEIQRVPGHSNTTTSSLSCSPVTVDGLVRKRSMPTVL